ncbi:unnamed protein product [Zymoseptoria tritici ST99CH_3D7]|uniref:GST C-terminal domain-containing protein n=1 Tax=Zymoseptoria tritici (strain ST99CH_3D7) TaxID=1276538 RepID=A0A1X7RTD1_ZYMT9|nr:unnamed protein product [Zymoseptoria tritici ST99CH_3D7]
MPPQEPILFLWGLSAWASKVTAYFALRGIPYTHCEQPITLPRPDLASLGINYRRIPLLSLGRDIYCDSLLILEKLELQYPAGGAYPSISATDAKDRALEKLLEKWTDVVVFRSAAAVISTDLDLMKDPGFQKDREELWGRSWSKEAQDALRPAALAEMRANWTFLEELLRDGREWVLGNERKGPGLADIHACWIFDWLLMLPGSFPEDYFNEKRFPNVLAWRERYKAAIEKAKESAPKPTEIEGKECVQKILGSDFNDDDLKVESDDPSGLKEGQQITMAPIDTGYDSADSGKLVGLTNMEAVISTTSKEGGKEMRVHYPRWNFTFKET